MIAKKDKIKGTCTECGEENCELTVLSYADMVCDDCLDGWYIQCERCGEYFKWEYVKFYDLTDGTTICEYCFNENPVPESEIESVNGGL